MRTELETQLLFCAPREVLLVGDMSGRTRKLLDGYAAPSSGVRSEAVARTHGAGGAKVVLETFFQASGGSQLTCYLCLHQLVSCMQQ